jgi:hypothetical protein
MKASDLKPLAKLAQRYGVKAVVYSKPGKGKTPMIAALPRPVILVTEPGTLSARKAPLTVPAWEAFTPEAVAEFFEWFFKSAEAKSFDSLGIDSGSQMAETLLSIELKRQKDGRKAYGEMSRKTMEYFDQLFFMPNKHIIIICKEMAVEVGKNITRQDGVIVIEPTFQAQPYFPGKELNILVPHRYDGIFHLEDAQIPGVGKTVAIRTKGTDEVLARDRSGNLAELEPPDLAALIAKAMQ